MTEPEHPIPSEHFDVALNDQYKQSHERKSSNGDSLLNQRGSTHGPRKSQSMIECNIKDAFRIGDFESLPYDMQSSLDMIATKISRIIAGDERHMDHWVDISGYAQLVIEDREE